MASIVFPQECSSKVQFGGLFVGASEAALNVKLIHCIPQLS
jgi:hypothetical protein